MIVIERTDKQVVCVCFCSCPCPSASISICFSVVRSLKKEEAPVCVACSAVITVKHMLIECADLLEIRKKYFEERSLYSLFLNVILEIIFDFLPETGLQNIKCVKEIFV